MAISFDNFVQWAEDRFQGDIVVKGGEVFLHSIFTEDPKYHLACSPSGGKHQRDDGCYRCFKTDSKGTLVGLVMEVDKCGYQEAKEMLSGSPSIRVMEEKLHEFFANKEKQQQVKQENSLVLPAYTWHILEMHEDSMERQSAISYLEKRKLPVNNLMFCTGGEYRNRIVIPYYDKIGKLIYFNARHIGDSPLRYMGPDKTVGVGKSDVLYAPQWPDYGSKIYVTEGEFDALALCICGFNGVACGGKTLSDKQLEMMRNYKICLALDGDIPGLGGLVTMGEKLLRSGITDISYVRPPLDKKDWNKMMIDYGQNVVYHYIQKSEHTYDEWTADKLLFT